MRGSNAKINGSLTPEALEHSLSNDEATGNVDSCEQHCCCSEGLWDGVWHQATAHNKHSSNTHLKIRDESATEEEIERYGDEPVQRWHS